MRSLDVFLYERRIGQLSLLPGDHTFFAFEETYSLDPLRETLSQGFISKTAHLLPETKPIRTRLHPFFSNLLPEGHLRDYLATKNKINPHKEFFLLEALGEDLPGAVTVRSSTMETYSKDLPEEIQNTSPKLLPYRFSLAGIQLKFSAMLKQKKRLTVPASGVGGSWIVKLPSASFPHIPENEYAMLNLAKHVGIQTPECHLVPLDSIEGLPALGPFQGSLALAVKRFDRGPNHTRIHMEDFAQVFGIYPEHKYEKVSYSNIANMIWILCGDQGLAEYIRRLVFCLLIGNGDMHLKNLSFLYPDKRIPVLSPAYDLLSTVPYISEDTLALTLVKTKQMQLCNESLFRALVEKAHLPKHLVLTTVRNTVEETKQAWENAKHSMRLNEDIISIIEKHMMSIPL